VIACSGRFAGAYRHPKGQEAHQESHWRWQGHSDPSDALLSRHLRPEVYPVNEWSSVGSSRNRAAYKTELLPHQAHDQPCLQIYSESLFSALPSSGTSSDQRK
jgi:hypothetical protein